MNHHTVDIEENETEEQQMKTRESKAKLKEVVTATADEAGESSNASSGLTTEVLQGSINQAPSKYLHLIRHRLKAHLKAYDEQMKSQPLVTKSHITPPGFYTWCWSKYKPEPETVAIGPYHRASKLESHKWFFLDRYTSRANNDLNSCLLQLEELEVRARNRYPYRLDMTSEEFIQMMLVDGCFLVELFCHVGRDKDFMDPIISTPWSIPVFMRDILKIDNQIPLFITRSLFGETRPPSEFFDSFFEFLNLSWPGPKLKYNSNKKEDEYMHLLDLFHQSLFSSVKVDHIEKAQNPTVSSVPCATLLGKSGIKFKPVAAQSFLDIKYEKNALLIPPITINEVTTALLYNSVAWERHQNYTIKYVSDYAWFMKCLIRKPEDAAFLCAVGIITNYSDDDRTVEHFFKELARNTSSSGRNSYLAKVYKDVDSYYGSYWANMMRTYFSSPWSFISVVSGFLLLALSMIQTIMSILSYKG